MGPQPTDPPWARLLFVVLEGRDGQCWRAVVLLTPLLLLVVLPVAGLVMVLAAAPIGWVSGTVGGGCVGSLIAGGLALHRQHRKPPPR